MTDQHTHDENPAGYETVFPGVDFKDLDDVSQLNRVLAELGSEENAGAFIQVYRMSKVGRDAEFLDRYDAAEFVDGSLLDTVRNDWGAGRYQFSVYGAGGGLRSRKVIQIAPRKNDLPAQANPVGSELSKIMEVIAQQNAQTQKMLESLAAAVVSNKQSAPSEMDMLDKMMKYKELFGSGEKSDSTKALLEGIALARELGAGGGETDSSWVDKVMTRLAVPAMEMIAANNNRQAATRPVAQVPPALTEGVPQVKSGAEVQTQQPEDGSMMFKMGVMMLLNAAKKNEDVNEVADRVMVMLPLSDVETIVNLENWFDVLCHHEKECANYKPWFDELHASLKEAVQIEKGDVPQ